MIHILRTAMRVLGYRQQDVEKKLGVSQGYLSRLFRGVMQLQYDHVVDIAHALGMEPDEIFQLAHPVKRNPPTEGAQRLREMLGPAPPADTAAAQPPAEPGSAPPAPSGPGSALEQELERIVERTMERMFANMAKTAGRRE